MLALSRGLSSVRSRWLDQVVVPYLASQSLGVGEPSTPRPTYFSPGFKDSGGRRDGLKCTRRRADTLNPPRQTCDSHSQPPGHNSKGGSGASEHLQSATNGTHETVDWTPAGAGTADGQHQPVRRHTPAGGNVGTAVGIHEDLDNGVGLEAYLERLRAILGTAVEGLFFPQACNLIVELVVSQSARRLPYSVATLGPDHRDLSRHRTNIKRKRFSCRYNAIISFQLALSPFSNLCSVKV